MQTAREYTSYEGAAAPGGRLAGQGRYPRLSADVDLALDAGPAAASQARHALGAVAGGVDPDLLEDVRLLVSELVTNSVRHSSSRPGATVGLRVGTVNGTLRVEVSDGGRGFEPRPRVAGQSKDSGWGLYLVDRIADRWGVRRSPVMVWFEIDYAGR